MRLNYISMFGFNSSRPLPPGTPAPPFLCPDQDGRVFILIQQRGKKLVLVFYPADNTPGCTKQLCALRDSYSLLRERGAVVYGINPGNESSHTAFRNKHSFPFPLLVDSGKRIAKLYRCAGLLVRRTVYVIDEAGVIRFARRGQPAVEEILAAL